MRKSCFPALFLILALSATGKDKPPITYRLPVPAKTDFTAIEWLVGDWTGKTKGREPQGEIHLSVSFDLEERFLSLRERVTLPASAVAPEISESWMGFLAGSGSGADFVLRVFSSTGF